MAKEYMPISFDEALVIRDSKDIVPYAGGTSIMPGTADYRKKLFLNNINSLKKIWEDKDSIYIGSCCTFTQLLSERSVPEVLKKAVEGIENPDIRNVGTIGGNICSAMPQNDTLPVLYALNSMIVLKSIEEKEILSIEEFIIGNKKTKLKKNQLLQYIIIPKQNSSDFYYRKVGSWDDKDASEVSFAGIVKTERGYIKRISIAIGGAGATVIRDRILEEKLTGVSVEELKGMKDEIADEYRSIINPACDSELDAENKKETAINLLNSFIDDIK